MPEQAPDPQAVDARTVDPRSADLLHRLVTHDAGASAEILARSARIAAATSRSGHTLVADRPSPDLDRAQRCATTARDRQLVALAAARLGGDAELLDALARDHLADYPDNELAAWIADPAAVKERA